MLCIGEWMFGLTLLPVGWTRLVTLFFAWF